MLSRRKRIARTRRWLPGRLLGRLLGGCAAGCLLLLVVAPRPANGFEFFDGRLAVHGFFEEQLRALGRDLDPADDIDLAQAYSVLNLEAEWNVAPDGWGPLDVFAAFARVEVRYDCVWVRCGIFQSVNTYGNRAEHLPVRLSDARIEGDTGTIFNGDRRPRLRQPVRQSDLAFRSAHVPDQRRPGPLWDTPLRILFEEVGPDALPDTADDPPFYVFERYVRPGSEYLFGARRVKGPIFGNDTQFLGPWLPENRVIAIGALRDRANPFRAGDVNPVMRDPATGDPITGAAELPFRPAPLAGFEDAVDEVTPQGIYYPSRGLQRMLRKGTLETHDVNFTQNELAWNRGGSQQDEKELKELYLDLELFDSRLWIRAGKQSIVWGKTELFRTTDQFNPQDFALATLPSLEESRIALWSARGVWSFYDVGPLQDVRLELALNYDDFQPADFGRCGEPFSPNPVCGIAFGLTFHGMTGVGLAGEVRPPDPWASSRGIEVGGRMEFRWSRFSFQISDFYGYGDFPHPEEFFHFERNVDPATGRPRQAGARGRCARNPGVLVNVDGDPAPEFERADDPDCLTPDEALTLHHANLQTFAMVCATTVGFSELDRRSCSQSLLNSDVIAQPPNPQTIAQAFSLLLSYKFPEALIGFASLSGFQPTPGDPMGYVDVNADGLVTPSDFPLIPLTNGDPGDGPGSGLDAALSAEQRALLGCGPLYGTTCHEDGVDLLNIELSAVIQSWPGFEGTTTHWDTWDASRPQPGTEGFEGGPVCTRFENGRLYMLPGCRGPNFDAASLDFVDEGLYDPAVDGTPPNSGANGGPLVQGRHPFACDRDAGGNVTDRSTCQLWATEMAALSWNTLMIFSALSGLGEADRSRIDFFDPSNPLGVRDVSDPTSEAVKCGFRKPYLCDNVVGFMRLVGVQRNVRRAAGNGRFGRRDTSWMAGGEVALAYEKRNVLGFAVDFTEDRMKTSWNLEATWIEGVPFLDNDRVGRLQRGSAYNLTASVDRPTFVNFLNPHRTFFVNSQWFFQYVPEHGNGFVANGPLNVFFTLTVTTGYSQDRLVPSLTWIYDFGSGSGGGLPEVTYRFTENLSATFGMNFFWGHYESRPMPLAPVGPTNRAGPTAYRDFVENGLSAIRDRDEAFLRIRYTF